MLIEEPDADLFFDLETSLHHPEVRSSRDLVDRLLADEFIEFGSSGRVYDKAITIEALAGEKVFAPALLPRVSDFSVRPLAEGVVLVTYTSTRSSDADDQAVRQSLRSSLYRFLEGRWQMVFHQVTPVPLNGKAKTEDVSRV